MKYNRKTVLTFGKHKDETIQKVLDDDPSYIVWMAENIKDAEFDDAIITDAAFGAEEKHEDWLRDNYD